MNEKEIEKKFQQIAEGISNDYGLSDVFDEIELLKARFMFEISKSLKSIDLSLRKPITDTQSIVKIVEDTKRRTEKDKFIRLDLDGTPRDG